MTIQRLLCVGLLVLGAIPAVAQNAGGTWNASIKTPQGDFPLVIELAASGKKLTGSFSNHFVPKIPIQDGSVSGNKVAFTLALPSVTLAYSGVVDGDKLTLTYKIVQNSGTNSGQSLGGVLTSVETLKATRSR